MYDNIGGKIKAAASWICVVEAIAAIIAGIALMIEGYDMFFIGLLLIIFGPVVAYVSTWLLYGFGQLIENSDIIANNINRSSERVIIKSKKNHRNNKTKATVVTPDIEEDEDENDDDEEDDDTYIDINCPYCQAELSYTKKQLRSQKLICPMCDAPISQ